MKSIEDQDDGDGGSKHPKEKQQKLISSVCVVEATDIVKADATGKSDPYVKFSIGTVCDSMLHYGAVNTKTLFQTNYIFQTLNPKWNKTFAIDIEEVSQCIESNSYPLHIVVELWDHDQIISGGCQIDFNPSDDLIGYARIPLHYLMRISSQQDSGIGEMADHKPVKEWFSLFLPRTIGKEDVDQDNVEKFHNTEYAGKILLEFKPVNIDANDRRLAALSMFRNYDLNEQLNVLHLQTITEKNAYLEGVPGLYSKEIRHEQIVQLMRNVYLYGTFVTNSGQRSIESSDGKRPSSVVAREGNLVVTSHRLLFVPKEIQEGKPSRNLLLPQLKDGVLQIYIGAVKKIEVDKSATKLRIITHDLRSFEVFVIAKDNNAKATVAAINLIADHIFWSLQEDNFYCHDNTMLRITDSEDKDIEKGDGMLRGSDIYTDTYSLTAEFQRQFSTSVEDLQKWKKSELNVGSKGRLCDTYPDVLYFPSDVSDETLRQAANFRKKNRLPALTYFHAKTGGILCRCSQPKAGIGGFHSSKTDIELVKKIALASRGVNENKTKQIFIIDCRSKLIATTNSLAGGGTEKLKWYEEKDQISAAHHYCKIDNIHEMRKSLNKLSSLLAHHVREVNPEDESKNRDEKLGATKPQTGWTEELRNSSWFHHLKLTIDAGVLGYEKLKQGFSVLVHCSDGWDRTAQVSSLIQVFADPYYRTQKGFCTLVAKEFCAFGHKFRDRGGYGHEIREESPIFLVSILKHFLVPRYWHRLTHESML